jgi:hypothetical protein
LFFDISFEPLALKLYLGGERLINGPLAVIIGIVPESVLAVPFVSPARVVNDRVKADALDVAA